MKYIIKLTRTELYHASIVVEASSPIEAKQFALTNHDELFANSGKLDLPDDCKEEYTIKIDPTQFDKVLGKEAIPQAVIKCGEKYQKIAICRPNDRRPRPHISDAVYRALKQAFHSNDEMTTETPCDIAVYDSRNRELAIIKSKMI